MNVTSRTDLSSAVPEPNQVSAPSESVAVPASIPASRPIGPAPSGVTAAADGHADRAALTFTQSRHPRFGDGVLYVGMNSVAGQCTREASLLASTGAGVRKIVGHSEKDAALGPDCVRVGGAVVDLKTPEGALAFATSLALSETQTTEIAKVIIGARTGARDELAQIATLFAQAERGGDVPSRIVLSGHCTGEGVYDGAFAFGDVRFADVFALARAMPTAAADIEDIMLSACSSGFAESVDFRTGLEEWRTVFPNLKTLWGYGGEKDFHSPTGDAALAHIAAWERATRGRAERLDPRASVMQTQGHLVGYEGNVSWWSSKQGYVQGK